MIDFLRRFDLLGCVEPQCNSNAGKLGERETGERLRQLSWGSFPCIKKQSITWCRFCQSTFPPVIAQRLFHPLAWCTARMKSKWSDYCHQNQPVTMSHQQPIAAACGKCAFTIQFKADGMTSEPLQLDCYWN